MIGNTIKRALGLTVSAVILSFCVPFSASAVDQLEKGCIGSFDYEMWNQNYQGKITFEPYEGAFTCSWENVESCTFSMGKYYDRKQNYKYLLTDERSLGYEAEFFPKGNSFIGVRGWTNNPFLEYIIDIAPYSMIFCISVMYSTSIPNSSTAFRVFSYS